MRLVLIPEGSRLITVFVTLRFQAIDKEGDGGVDTQELRNSLSIINYPDLEWQPLADEILEALKVDKITLGP